MDELELLRKIALLMYNHKKSKLEREYLDAMYFAADWYRRFDGKRIARTRAKTEGK
jgi:hypothetical protein